MVHIFFCGNTFDEFVFVCEYGELGLSYRENEYTKYSKNRGITKPACAGCKLSYFFSVAITFAYFAFFSLPSNRFRIFVVNFTTPATAA